MIFPRAVELRVSQLETLQEGDPLHSLQVLGMVTVCDMVHHMSYHLDVVSSQCECRRQLQIHLMRTGLGSSSSGFQRLGKLECYKGDGGT